MIFAIRNIKSIQIKYPLGLVQVMIFKYQYFISWMNVTQISPKPKLLLPLNIPFSIETAKTRIPLVSLFTTVTSFVAF